MHFVLLCDCKTQLMRLEGIRRLCVSNNRHLGNVPHVWRECHSSNKLISHRVLMIDIRSINDTILWYCSWWLCHVLQALARRLPYLALICTCLAKLEETVKGFSNNMGSWDVIEFILTKQAITLKRSTLVRNDNSSFTVLNPLPYSSGYPNY